MTRFSNKLLLPSLYPRSLPILNRWCETYWNAHGYYQLEKVVKIIKYSLLASIFHQSILQVVSSFPLPLIEEPRSGYDKDDKLTGLHQCTLAENLKYSLNFLTKSISRNHQMRMSAKTMSTYTGFEPSITKEMIEVREACPGECKDRKREHLPWGSFCEWWRWVLVLIYPQHEECRWQLAATPSKTVRCFLPSPLVASLVEWHSKISVFSSRWHFAGLIRFPQAKPSIKPFSSSCCHRSS